MGLCHLLSNYIATITKNITAIIKLLYYNDMDYITIIGTGTLPYMPYAIGPVHCKTSASTQPQKLLDAGPGKEKPNNFTESKVQISAETLVGKMICKRTQHWLPQESTLALEWT